MDWKLHYIIKRQKFNRLLWTHQHFLFFFRYPFAKFQVSGKHHQLHNTQVRAQFITLHDVAAQFAKMVQVALLVIDKDVSSDVRSSNEKKK